MDHKPSAKFIIVMNIVLNLPLATAMSIAAPLVSGQPITAKNLIVNIIIGFVCACILNAVVPVQRILKGFPALFKINPDSFAGAAVGNIPVCLIFVAVIGFVMTWYNVRVFPIVFFAYLGTFIPLFIVCYIVSMIFTPIAMKAAFEADSK